MKYCTLTGADNTTDPKALIELSIKYPFVEWGILYSESKMGTGRYPTKEWINSFVDAVIEDWEKNSDGAHINICLHICGSAVSKFINNTDRSLIALADAFDRVQLNFRSNNFPIVDIISCLNRYPVQQIITQHNNANKLLVKHLSKQTNHALLFDTSGGRGIETAEWIAPLDKKLWGYAGGLGPDNVVEQLRKIQSLNKGRDFYIDMENKLRTDDKFDLTKVRKVLELVKEYA